MLAVVKSLDKTESGMPMAYCLDEKGISHWLFNGNHFPVGTKIVISFIEKGYSHWEWVIVRKAHG